MRRLATVVTTLALSVSGLVFSPAQANVPVDGDYNCAGGVKDGAGTKYAISNGVVSSGGSCTGAVVIPAGVTSIGNNAFQNSLLTSINIPSSVTSIGERAFNGAKLTSVTIPSSVTSLGARAFQDATALTSITIPSSITSIGLRTFQATTALTSITIPSSVTSIGELAFKDSGITSITIPASVTSITAGAFETSQITTVAFASGSSLTGIPAGAFIFAQKLTSITIPETFTSIGADAFRHTRVLTAITIPANVTSIGSSAFFDSQGLATVTFAPGSKLTTIGVNAFKQTPALTSINIPASVTTINEGALETAGSDLSIPQSLTEITVDPANLSFTAIDGVLFDKNIATLIQYPAKKIGSAYSIPSTVTSIRPGAFARATNLTSVTIPESITTIGDEAFRQATALSSVTIPSGVTSIGTSAFNGASTLANITFTGNAAPTIGSSAFSGVASSAKACVKTGATGFTASGSPTPRWNGIGVNDGAYMASFNANGGSTVAGVSFLANGQISSAPAEPTKAGHTFAGWTATDGGSTILTFPHTPSATCGTTLHAKWDLIPVVNEPAPAVNNPAPAASNPAPSTASTSTAQPATTNVVSAKANYTAKSLATQVGVRTVSPKATVTISVAKSSKKFCTKSGSRLKTLKAGSCVVTITVQEPKPKGGKKPKATKTTKTLVVS